MIPFINIQVGDIPDNSHLGQNLWPGLDHRSRQEQHDHSMGKINIGFPNKWLLGMHHAMRIYHENPACLRRTDGYQYMAINWQVFYFIKSESCQWLQKLYKSPGSFQRNSIPNHCQLDSLTIQQLVGQPQWKHKSPASLALCEGNPLVI